MESLFRDWAERSVGTAVTAGKANTTAVPLPNSQLRSAAKTVSSIYSSNSRLAVFFVFFFDLLLVALHALQAVCRNSVQLK